jgi:alkyl sulfatase BDS1-like metallo-beta-lactamase superfamily hydrolase
MNLRHLTLPLALTVSLGEPVMAQDAAKPATEATKAANAAVLDALPFDNTQAFEDAKRGLIAPLKDSGLVKNAKGACCRIQALRTSVELHSGPWSRSEMSF